MSDPGTGEHRSEFFNNLELLRGPNNTLKLASLIEDSTIYSTATNTRAYDGVDTTVRQHAIIGLQEWAQKANNEILRAVALDQPTNKEQLLRVTGRAIENDDLSSSLDLTSLFVYHGRENYLARQDQWALVRALFGIDTTGIKKGSGGVWWMPGTRSSIEVDINKINDYLHELVEGSIKRRGGKLIKDTNPLIHRGKPFVKTTGSTAFDGVTASLTTEKYPPHAFHAGGMPLVKQVVLRFTPEFLASVRPLDSENYLKYWPPKEPPKKEWQEEVRRPPKPEGGIDPRDPSAYYKTLGVNPDIDPEDLEEVLLSAYRRLSRKYHPDTGGENANPERMRALNQAFEFLKDPDKRKSYGRKY
ncbi:MAG: hypothetical protein A3F61_00255 [Candidatus Blackburnbacteria bacterium RIFCSPHIGHO2_12_FULL_41_13b]|uniref:J domain-containing protein n=1 Tax=Candidatus Blackburnbacteria bacterium RIFCSPHIGHO2_12_FULL_41_13b TaxID=1797517 RepID=A0A1G1V7Z5_9BACT|nr:MAG: hypothetical protein A3F61_00255 [Candidatus Blackburnbacteria bacterium RIFCSPHIGHO2_12_FULL_41_13b]